ncbi:MAG: FG-GAP repeat protein [Planctomycetes bacterium]|nr:FG-GAP repeat protein [Planctomycetota bacterium]
MTDSPRLTRGTAAVSLALASILTQCHSHHRSTPANSIVVRPLRVVEGTGVAPVILQRQQFVRGPVTVRYTTVDRTARAPHDYEQTQGSVTWADDDSAPKVVQVRLVADSWTEPAEAFTFRILEVTGGVAAGTSTVIAGGSDTEITIEDDDQAVPSGWQANHSLLSTPGAKATSPCGDVNGDGAPDLLCGDPAHNGGAGRLWVVSGRTGQVLHDVAGTATTDHLGTLVTGLGDVDGDGIVDFAGHGTGGSTWMVRVFSGRTGTMLYEIKGDPLDTRPVTTLTSIGDLNADGRPDFALGIPDDHATFGPARVGLFSGADGSRIRWLQAPATGERFGAAIAAIADLTGDKVTDVLVGAPTATGAAANSGAVYLINGAGGQQIARIPGDEAGSEFGASVSPAGDTDADGTTDIAVGAPAADKGAGAAFLFRGDNRALLRTWRLGSANAKSGASVAAAGDLDGDAHADVMVGSPGARTITVYSGLDGSALFTMTGTEPGFGTQAEVLGDTNGDGGVDFVVRSDTSAVIQSTKRLALSADGSIISLANPGKISFSVDAGIQHAGRNYWIGSSLGTNPGFDLGAAHIPLNYDAWFETVVRGANTVYLNNTRSTLDSEGRATASFNTPPLTPPVGLGVTVYFAYLAYDADGTPRMGSNAVPVRFVE